MDSSPNTNNGGRVAKLLSKSLPARRWKKQQSRESLGSTASSEEASRGRSPHGRELIDQDDPERDRSTSLSQSQFSETIEEEEQRRGREREQTAMSPIPDELELEPSPTLRPTGPSTHPSQIGHLTTSSPIIQAEHTPEVQNIDELADESLESLSRSATYSVSVSSNNPAAVPGRQLSVSKTGLLPNQSLSSGRSRSPAGRIKDAFKSKRNSSATPSLSTQQTDKVEQADISGPGSQRPTISPAQTSDLTVASEPDTNDAQVASPERSRRLRTHTPIDTSNPPRTPPSSEHSAPVIVNTPPTPTDHSHPDRQGTPAERATPAPRELASKPTATVPPSGNMISQRRGRSGSTASLGPSKLSNITLAPLTPTPENAAPLTPGGGFFSSMISAAQNAATTFSNTVTTTNIGLGGNKPKTPVPVESQEGDGDTTEVEAAAGQIGEANMGEPAVKTLGLGDLSLSQLGIQETGSGAPTPQTSKFSELVADTRSRSESAPDSVTLTANGAALEEPSGSRPRSLYESTGHSDQTPPTSIFDGKPGIQRSGSIRSTIGRRRKRGSTGGTAGTNGTGTTIAAAIAAANASVAHPNATGSAPKLTGFAVASKKRNRDFHTLFKSVPDDDYLIEDYSCALQREILAHGRLYVSEGHLCFSSNIFGWVTTLVMSFDEIVSVEKRSTALVFKNGLMISTLHAKHVFASFTSRDSTYDLIVNIWKLGHPTLRSSLNGVSLDETGGDKTEKVDDDLEPSAYHSGSGSDVDEDVEDSGDGDDDVYDEDEEDDDAPEISYASEVSPADTEADKAVTRKVSGAVGANGSSDKPKDSSPIPTGGADFPGPATHAPTDCGDAATHYERIMGDEIIPAPLGKVYNLMFGPASVTFMAKWLTVDQKCMDLQMEDKTGLTQDNRSRAYTYIKPLYASIGPRQTKCIVVETLENLDLEKSVNILVATQNPDVPSGNVFSVKTKYCLHWAENNATRVQINCTIEWTGKSWLKGPIEKGANEGQMQTCKELLAHLKASVSSRPRSATLAGGPGAKGKKRKGKKLHKASKESLNGATESTGKKHEAWGLLEPLHGILGPLVDIIKPILTGNVVYGLLVGLLVASWFGFGFNPRQAGVGYGPGIGFPTQPDRLIAYEELWRREETDLWDWLEERVGLHRMHDGDVPIRRRVTEPRSVEEKIREDRMNEREIEEAIRITEEKLNVLKEVHDRKKPTGGPDKLYSRPTTRPETDT